MMGDVRPQHHPPSPPPGTRGRPGKLKKLISGAVSRRRRDFPRGTWAIGADLDDAGGPRRRPSDSIRSARGPGVAPGPPPSSRAPLRQGRSGQGDASPPARGRMRRDAGGVGCNPLQSVATINRGWPATGRTARGPGWASGRPPTSGSRPARRPSATRRGIEDYLSTQRTAISSSRAARTPAGPGSPDRRRSTASDSQTRSDFMRSCHPGWWMTLSF